nr:MAG TPA: INTERNALIN B BINDING, LEUCINE RICH REPEAT.2A [Caudoviricetes sp.]
MKTRGKNQIVTLLFAIAILIGFTFLSTACETENKNTYTVTLWSEINPYRWEDKHTAGWFLDFPAVYKTVEVAEGDILGNIELPNGADEHFLGWFIDKNYTLQFNQFVDPVKADITLYAKWDIER